MIFYPNAKINIGLDIIEKRSDGFHNIETVFYPIQLSDILEIIPSNELIFSATGIEIDGESHSNLCMKAYLLLKKDFPNLPLVNIHLHKIVPIGAGLGGGSSDAAFTLKALNELFELNLSKQELKTYASQLGSDCAFFIENEPCLAVEKGDILEPISLTINNLQLLLVYPKIHVSTPMAYSGVNPKVPPIRLKELIKTPIQEWKNTIKNDFESSIFKRFTQIELIKERMYMEGAMYAAMSGSGSSVFGIFEENTKLESLFDAEKYFVWTEKLGK